MGQVFGGGLWLTVRDRNVSYECVLPPDWSLGKAVTYLEVPKLMPLSFCICNPVLEQFFLTFAVSQYSFIIPIEELCPK